MSQLGERGKRIVGAVLLVATLSGLALCGAEQAGAALVLPDGRAWELVSPVEKNGGAVAAPEAVAGGGLLQAAEQGGAVTFSSATAFGDAQGAPLGSQYLATRGGGGWSTQNLTVPVLSGTYATDDGVPYRLFSTDLARGLMLNGGHCRGEGVDCPVENPPLPGSGAPAGYQNYYQRTTATGAFGALLTSTELNGQNASSFDVTLSGATPDLSQVVLSSCAALTSNATEIPLGGSCDPSKQNLYRWAAGQGLSLINLLPAQATGTPGATLAAQSTAISTNGSNRVYFTHEGNLYLRDGGVTKQADADAGGGGTFQVASTDGSVAYFIKAGHLWRYLASTDAATDITPSGGVAGVLGASADGSYLYFQDATALKLWHSGATTTVAFGAAASEPENWPPTVGTARVSADGGHLLFSSTAELSGYDNRDKVTAVRDAELFLYDAGANHLTCVSCNPSKGRPAGSSSVPGSVPNGTTTNAYKPRALSANGRRVLFDSRDVLVVTDTNSAPDVYQWEAQGEGSCSAAAGCIGLISDGRDAGGSSFADASTDGSDAYFLSEASLVSSGPGSVDLYDAKVGGGFPEPPVPIPCEGDSCQVLPSEPVDPTLTTLLSGLGNPKVHYFRYRRHVAKPPKHGHKQRCKKGAKKAGRACKGKKGNGR